jgi:hypothetical protein
MGIATGTWKPPQNNKEIKMSKEHKVITLETHYCLRCEDEMINPDKCENCGDAICSEEKLEQPYTGANFCRVCIPEKE